MRPTLVDKLKNQLYNFSPECLWFWPQTFHSVIYFLLSADNGTDEKGSRCGAETRERVCEEIYPEERVVEGEGREMGEQSQEEVRHSFMHFITNMTCLIWKR